jgi:hypothetical protein
MEVLSMSVNRLVQITGGVELRDFLEKVKQQRGEVDAGFLNAESAKIAIIQEYGANINVTKKMRKWFAFKGIYLSKNKTQINLPPRPFMQQTADNNRSKWRKQLLQLIKSNNYQIGDVLDIIGQVMASDIQKTMAQGKFVPNAPLTVDWKGFNKPLVNTGDLSRSVDYEVTKK